MRRRPLRWLEAISFYRATTSGGPTSAYEACAAAAAQCPVDMDLSSWQVAFVGVRVLVAVPLRERPSAVRFPAGETLAEVQGRGVKALDDIAAAHPRGTVAVVCHADVVRLALMQLIGLHIDFIERVVVAPASVSAVSIGHGIPRLVALGCIGDLRHLAPRPRPAPRKVGG